MTILLLLTIYSLLNYSLSEKRLLIDDPDVLAQRLGILENLVHQQAETIKQQSDTISNLTSKLSVLQDSIGSTFVHWGRSDCQSKDTELVYSGFVGGGHYDETGASPEFVCLPTDPKLRETTGGYDYGRMYGAEYGTDFWGQHPNPINNELPCAVCRSQRTSTTIMIPGKDTCQTGWKIEYHGYLGSSHHSYTSGSMYICVDINHQSVPGGGSRINGGKRVVNVVAECGSLQCPPYTNGDSFSCVVCSK
ncbi:Hypothetical predicted protein [Mytilus galloprovincialis]|uniref:Short-chain collagen C4-like n=1 Tax=Mytilus galloprovincialis TaxID=29158 RepID=A0A8B6BPC0_MYTGA|nr:Hypothetical predicted protein [Mytilus galloprovincialis]